MKVLIATDGSEFSNEAIKKCCRIINKTDNLEIKVISVYERVPLIGTEPFAVSAEYINDMGKAMKKEAEDYAKQAVKIINKSLTDCSFELTTKVEMGIPEQEILETAREWNADLIAVGSHGRGFWGRTMIGSTSDAIVHNAHCPVLVVQKAEKAKAKSGGN